MLIDIARRTPALEVRTRSGLSVRCPNVPGARVPLYELFVGDTYRLEDLLRDLPPDLTVLDVGGHIGCFSLAVARIRPEATVHTYEASADTARVLEENIARNGFAGRVHPHAIALADRNGALQFATGQFASGLNGLSNQTPSDTTTVPCRTFAEAVGLAGGAVDLVKVDTEGAEYAIILGSRADDWAAVRKVVLEFHEVPGHRWTELRDFFTAAGFRLERTEFGGPGYGMLWFGRR